MLKTAKHKVMTTKKAKDNYSEEDIRKAVIFGQSVELTFVTEEGKEILTNEFIEKLKQEYVESETE